MSKFQANITSLVVHSTMHSPALKFILFLCICTPYIAVLVAYRPTVRTNIHKINITFVKIGKIDSLARLCWLILLSICDGRSKAKSKGIVVPIHTMKACRGSRGIDPHSLKFQIEVSASCPGQFTTQRRTPQYALNRRLGGPWSQYGNFVEGKNFLPLPEIKPWIVQPVVQSLH